MGPSPRFEHTLIFLIITKWFLSQPSISPELDAVAKPLGPIAPGKTVITPAFNLPAKHIIHTDFLRYIYGTPEEKILLAMAYRSALSLKLQAPDATSTAFVSLGTGIHRWPLEVVAEIAVTELRKSEFDVCCR